MVLDIARRGAVLMLTMNRPERRNALDRHLYRDLGQAFVAAETEGRGAGDDVRARRDDRGERSARGR